MAIPSGALRPAGSLRHLILFVLTATLFFSSCLRAPAAVEAANCQFALGFATLHDLIPRIVGNCLTNEQHASNGDGLQRTTNGLLVWRKADNVAAFTDGYRTWVNGPEGFQERLNTTRFSWEPDVAPANFDPRLTAAYHLAANSQFGNLISYVVAQKIPVRFASLPGAFGAFFVDPTSGQQRILINQSLAGIDPNDAAAVLIHEATHAYDRTHQPNFGTTAGCFQTELRAKLNDLAFWRAQFGPNGKQPPANQFEVQENALLRLGETNPQALLRATFDAYVSQCA